MREKNLPVLPHQETEIREAGLALDAQRPGATQDLMTAMKHEPSIRAGHEPSCRGRSGSRHCLPALSTRSQVRRDPNLRVERLVKEWKGLEAKRKASREWEKPEEHAKLKKDMTELTREFKRDAAARIHCPAAQSAARDREGLDARSGSPVADLGSRN